MSEHAPGTTSAASAHWQPPRLWLPPARRWQRPPPPPLLTWLDEPASLTARLQRLAGGKLRVRVLREGWARPTAEERRRLRLTAREYAWVREVLLIGDGEPWVQARSILPRRSLTGAGRRLARLGNRSLGGLLFRDPALRRGAIDIAELPPHDGQAPAWGRRSVLHLRGHAVLVAEAFLPALLRAADSQAANHASGTPS
ncbi:chorismate--pyruvate lyase family protein [Amnimonas aquatica]|uniref:Probable chorismate pyruvate-lyase n=1 Tax=Amnimonas aquatica TaxID=2094561 RepID=A0A2P6AUA3_9GAMM|nr:chorismate lyase [Amnimonas aquatica]PQA49425.1 chorismate lyase [Amnimonas aquatica]